MRLSSEQEYMLSGKEGRSVQKAMEILVAMGEACGADKLVKITYAHLMPPEVMFFPYGKQGQWGLELTQDLMEDLRSFKVFTTIEPKFCNLSVAKDLQFTEDIIGQIEQIQEPATQTYEQLGTLSTYTAMPFYYYQAKRAEHISVAESIATLWYNTMFGAKCERDDGVTSLSAAITGYIPLSGAHLDSNRHAEIVVRPSDGLKFDQFDDADWDAYSLAISRKCKEKRPALIGIPPRIGMTALKHLLAVIAVESGLAVMHIVGVTPEAPTLKAALGDRKPLNEFSIERKDIDEAYEIANTAKSREVDFIMIGCPHTTLREFRDLAEILDGKKIHSNVKLIVSTNRLLLTEATDLGYVDAIQGAGGLVTLDMCIAFAGSNVKGTIATNSIKAVFFYSGFCATRPNPVRFGSTKDCAKSAVSGKWEGRL